MPDYRYRQTTVTLNVPGFAFRAAGRQPIEVGWRDDFPDWRPAEEKGEEAQALPVLRDGETARLRDPEIEDKETRPPPRYKEGTLIEAMQNAWRFVEDEALRDRLKEAKGIGTPATRGEIIAGLKKQGCRRYLAGRSGDCPGSKAEVTNGGRPEMRFNPKGLCSKGNIPDYRSENSFT